MTMDAPGKAYDVSITPCDDYDEEYDGEYEEEYTDDGK